MRPRRLAVVDVMRRLAVVATIGVLAAATGCARRTRTHGPGHAAAAAQGNAPAEASGGSDASEGSVDAREAEASAIDGASAARVAPAPGSTETAPDAPFRAPLVAARPHPATVHSAMAPGACAKEIERLGLPFTRSKQAAAGVAYAMRSSGPLHGVRIVIPGAPSKFGVMDCRLALALAGMAEVAATMGVVQIQVDNVHRTSAKLPRRGAGKSQHAYGLAADITTMKLSNGQVLSVERDWHAPIGSTSCGPDAVLEDPTPEAIALRNIVCELARRGVFHHMLTPGYDAAHRNHLHLDLKRGVTRTRIH